MVQAIENKLKTAKNRISILLDNTDIASGELLQATKEGQTLAQLLQQNFQQRREHKEIIADLRAQMTDLTVRINTLTRDLDSCHETAGNSETELNNYRSELMNTRKQLENCKSQLALNEMMLKDCERQKETLQSALTDAQQQLSTGSQKQQELAADIQGHLRDIEQNEKERDELQKQQVSLNSEFDKLKTEHRDLKTHTARMGLAGDGLNAKNVELEREINELQAKYEQVVLAGDGLNAKNEQLTRDLADLTGERDRLVTENHALQQHIVDLQGQYTTLQGEQATLQGQHDTLRGEHDTLRGEHDTLRGQHDNLEAQNQELQGQIANLTMERNALQANRNELQGQHDTLRGEHDTLRGEHDTLREQHANVNNDIQALRAQRDQLIAAIDNASRVIDETIGQISAILNTGENSEDITRSLEELLQRLTVMSNDNIGEFEAQPGLPPRPPGLPPRTPGPNQERQTTPFFERVRNRNANPPTLSDLRLSIPPSNRTEQQTLTNRPSAFTIAPPSGQNTDAIVNPLIQRRGRGLGTHYVARRNPLQPTTQNADTQNLYGSLINEPTRFNTDNPMISPPSSPRKGGKKRKNTKKAKRTNKKNKITKKRIKQTAGFLYNKHLVNPFQKRTTRRNKYTHSSSIKGSPKSSVRYYNRIGSPRTISYRSKHKHARRVKSRRSSISSAY